MRTQPFSILQVFGYHLLPGRYTESLLIYPEKVMTGVYTGENTECFEQAKSVIRHVAVTGIAAKRVLK
jgi:hypothetical protein